MRQKCIELIQEYDKLNLHSIKDYDLFNQIAIVHHSSGIEGSTLSLTDTQLLITEGITPKGKPLAHSLMEKDHYEALLFTLNLARKKQTLRVENIQQINAEINRHTGEVLHTALGSVDVSKGEFRKSNVRAGETYFVNYDKVIPLTNNLVNAINEKLECVDSTESILDLAFTAHFDLVMIHPFIDGNGRTSRLLMNYIQERFSLPLSIVFKEDRADYIESLKTAKNQENTTIFLDFMYAQYAKFLEAEIRQEREIHNNIKHKGRGFSLVF